MKRALVCGAGGFIGGHLVKKLKREGYWVRGVDMKEQGSEGAGVQRSQSAEEPGGEGDGVNRSLTSARPCCEGHGD